MRGAYVLAWELACKGITVYRAGSREAEVLTKGAGEGKAEPAEAQDMLVERQRPAVVTGVTERVRTAHGNLFVTINYDGDGMPFEVFAALGKAGSTESAHLEAITRLITMALRAGVDPNEVIKHLKGITDSPTWDGGTLVRSVPDAVSLVLSRHISGVATPDEAVVAESPRMGLFTDEPADKPKGTNGANGIHGRQMPAGIRCPYCSTGVLIHQEGCERCPECGYNRCEEGV